MKMLAPLILWTVLLQEVWNQGVARLQKHGNPSFRRPHGPDWRAERRRQWAFRRMTLASLEPRWARPLQMALDALYQSTELELSNTDDLNIQQTWLLARSINVTNADCSAHHATSQVP